MTFIQIIFIQIIFIQIICLPKKGLIKILAIKKESIRLSIPSKAKSKMMRGALAILTTTVFSSIALSRQTSCWWSRRWVFQHLVNPSKF